MAATRSRTAACGRAAWPRCGNESAPAPGRRCEGAGSPVVVVRLAGQLERHVVGVRTQQHLAAGQRITASSWAGLHEVPPQPRRLVHVGHPVASPASQPPVGQPIASVLVAQYHLLKGRRPLEDVLIHVVHVVSSTAGCIATWSAQQACALYAPGTDQQNILSQ